MKKTLQDIAKEVLYTPGASNGYGIKCSVITDVCDKYNVNFKELFVEIIRQRDIEDREE